jgi:hypothetical protein
VAGIPEEDRPPGKDIYRSIKWKQSNAKWKTINDSIMQFTIENYKPIKLDDRIAISIGCPYW